VIASLDLDVKPFATELDGIDADMDE